MPSVDGERERGMWDSRGTSANTSDQNERALRRGRDNREKTDRSGGDRPERTVDRMLEERGQRIGR